MTMRKREEQSVTMIESGRGLPVLHEVDVVVVGGTTAAVTAAIAAAEQGASVFLAAPRSYLGEDLCASARLWLEPDEEPDTALARKMFAPPLERRGLDYTYETDHPCTRVHTDYFVPVTLNDGHWGHAFGHSLQSDGSVTITASLGQRQDIKEARLMLFQVAGDFGVESVSVSVSDDKQTWHPAGVFENSDLGARDYVEEALALRCPLDVSARHVRLELRQAPDAKRILLGQLQLLESRPRQDPSCKVVNATPMQIKRVLDDALVAAKIPFLFECAAVEVLKDAKGGVAGIELVNRAGRQVVMAKVVVDGTERALVARMAGAAAAPYAAGAQTFKRIVVGGEARMDGGLKSRRIPLRFPMGDLPSPVEWADRNAAMCVKVEALIEYTLTLPMQDASFASFAEAEQIARDLTFHPSQMEAAERLFQIPPDPITGLKNLSGEWAGAERVDLDAFRLRGVPHLFVLGACADISRSAAECLIRPLEFMAMGHRIGAAAAREAEGRRTEAVVWPTADRKFCGGLDTKELLQGARPWEIEDQALQVPARSISVLGDYDVVVVGGGTSGACAAIGAARSGARTLVIENLHGLGGVGTLGMIGCYCHGHLKGLTEEKDRGVEMIGAISPVIGRMEWYRQEIRKAGGEIWFGAQGAGALVEDGRVKGVLVASPHGRGVVLADVVVDASGNADIAAAAGAECEFVNAEHFGMQQAGLPRCELGATYFNSDWTYANDVDMIDRWTMIVVARRLNGNAYDLSQLLDTRERRHIIGDYTLSPMDVVNSRTFPDTINIALSGTLDKHSEPIHPYLRINNYPGGITSVPYRCLLPKGLDGILVVGLGISADADATPAVRMQPDMQNQGYGAGLAAAMAAEKSSSVRTIDFPKLQSFLVAKGCIPAEYAGGPDSFPPSLTALQKAVQMLMEKDYSLLRLLLIDPGRVLPLLREAWGTASEPAGKLRCAHVLGMMGDATGVETLVAAVESHTAFDVGDIGHFYPRLTWLDSYMLALGNTRDSRALRPLLDKLSLLSRTPDTRHPPTESHLYCISMALEALGDSRAAAPLAAELRTKGAARDAALSLEDALARHRAYDGYAFGHFALELARGLWRCGDYEGLARKTLEAFANDVRGPIALHARSVLGLAKGDCR